MIVLDTSTLLFWTFAPEKLSANALKAMEANSTYVVNAVSIWEIAWKIRRGKLVLPLSVRAYVDLLLDTERIDIRPTELAIWLQSVELDWEHKDPADRIIVATASLLGCPLVTSDRRIREFYALAIW